MDTLPRLARHAAQDRGGLPGDHEADEQGVLDEDQQADDEVDDHAVQVQHAVQQAGHHGAASLPAVAADAVRRSTPSPAAPIAGDVRARSRHTCTAQFVVDVTAAASDGEAVTPLGRTTRRPRAAATYDTAAGVGRREPGTCARSHRSPDLLVDTYNVCGRQYLARTVSGLRAAPRPSARPKVPQPECAGSLAELRRRTDPACRARSPGRADRLRVPAARSARPRRPPPVAAYEYSVPVVRSAI